MADRQENACLKISRRNAGRGDDGIGPLVAKALSRLAPVGVRILTRPSDMLALIADWKCADAVLIADAAALDSEPGRIHRIDAVRETLPGAPSSPSTHAFGLAEAVELARTLGTMPSRLIVFAIKGAHFEPGTAMAESTAAAGEVARQIMAGLPILSGQADHQMPCLN